MNISKSDIVNSFKDVSDTFVRYISKEGVGKFPTVVFLANKMFLSDDENIIKDLNLPYKIAVHDDYHWAKRTDFYNGFKELMDRDKKNILSDIKMFNIGSIGYNVSRIFNVSDTLNYYLTADKKLIYGSSIKFNEINFDFKDTLIATFPIKFTETEESLAWIKAQMAAHGFVAERIDGNYAYSTTPVDPTKITIFRQDNVDYMLTEHCVYKINPNTKSVTPLYSYINIATVVDDDDDDDEEEYEFDTDISFPTFRYIGITGDNAAIATDKGCYSIKGVLSENWVFYTQYIYQQWTVKESRYVSDGNGGTKLEYYDVTVDNGLPTNNNLDFAYISGNDIIAGSFSYATAGSFVIGSVQNHELVDYTTAGTSVANSLSKRDYYCGTIVTNYAGTISIASKGTITVSEYPLSFSIDNNSNCVYLTYADRIDCYSFDSNRIIFTFRPSNNMPGSGNIGAALDKSTSLLLFTNNGTVYKMVDETVDATVTFITTDFVYDNDKETKKLHCVDRKCSGRQLVKYLVSQDNFISEICRIDGHAATFLIALFVKTNGRKVFVYFGDDTRNVIAREIKSISSAFGIEP